jgi:hypothetical protein
LCEIIGKNTNETKFDQLTNNYFRQSSGVAELAKASIVHPSDTILNLGKDRKYFLFLFVSHLNKNL